VTFVSIVFNQLLIFLVFVHQLLGLVEVLGGHSFFVEVKAGLTERRCFQCPNLGFACNFVESGRLVTEKVYFFRVYDYLSRGLQHVAGLRRRLRLAVL